MEHTANKEQVFTVRAFAGDLPVECFLSARGFLEDHSLLRPSFSEDHVHASFELLLCRKGSGYQFIEGVAHAYTDESVFLLAPFVTHAHIANPEGRRYPRRGDGFAYEVFFGALRRAGYDGCVSVEAFTDDFARDAKEALDCLRALVKA